MSWELAKDIIWNIGGALSLSLTFLVIIVWLWDKLLKWSMGMFDKKVMKDIFYWIKNKEKIRRIIKEERK